MSMLMTTMLTLAGPAQDIDPATGKGSEWGKAAPVGLLVILLMCVAVFFLMRSMTRNMRKVPTNFGPPDEERLLEESDTQGPDGQATSFVAEPEGSVHRAPEDVSERDPVERP